MSKSRKRKGGQQSLEKKAFETLSKQIHQFDEPKSFAGKNNYGKGSIASLGNRRPGYGKPSKFIIRVRLSNGKIIQGTCVNFDNPKMPKSKLFFPTKASPKNNNYTQFLNHVIIIT
jgi:hypothetical protein